MKARSALALPAPTREPHLSTKGLQKLLAESLWPIVDAAFRDVGEHVEARFFQIDDLQVVISRAPARSAHHRDTAQRLTLELWPLAGPRVLVVEWSGHRPYVVHRRDGDWLQTLVRISRHSR